MASPNTDTETLNAYRKLRDDLILGGVSSYTIANRTFSHFDLPEIERLISYYELKISRKTNGIKVGVAIGRNC